MRWSKQKQKVTKYSLEFNDFAELQCPHEKSDLSRLLGLGLLDATGYKHIMTPNYRRREFF